MERITISLRAELAQQFDDYIRGRGYSNRSEAMRDLIRDRIEGERLESGVEGSCVAVLSYLYSHAEFDLPSRLTSLQHASHQLSITSTHVHLNEQECLETLILRGPVGQVRAFADRLIAERGVRSGRIHLMPLEQPASRLSWSPEQVALAC